MNEHSKLIVVSTNKLLNYLKEISDIPCGLPSNEALAGRLNVSRSTVLKIIDVLCEKGIARKDGSNKILLRRPRTSDYFSSDELDNSKADKVEKQIKKKISAYELRPGDRFSELELSKKLNSNTVTVREALIKIAQTGIIKKYPYQKWEVVELSLDMVEEIVVIRKLYERYAIEALQKLPENHFIWDSFKELKSLHKKLLKQSGGDFDELTNTEYSFHTTLIKACQNRFIEESYKSIFKLINFHLWQIEYDLPKITRVLKQHLAIINALLARDFSKATKAMEQHLEHAKQSMKEVNKKLEKDKSGTKL